MTTHAELYNGLPSIDEADGRFTDRDQMFAKLAPLLARYDKKYGLSLVHRHCTLEEGERMVATGNVSQPERDVNSYPERWLASGVPYEFTRVPTEPPPQELLDEFQKIILGVDVLGLFYVHDRRAVVERNEGRKNIVEVTSQINDSDISAGWIMGPHALKAVLGCPPPTHSAPEPSPPTPPV